MTTASVPSRPALAPRVRPIVPARQPVAPVPQPKPKQEGKWFLNALSVILLGYAVSGTWFAYLGFPPVYVSEMVLALGVLTVFRYPSMLGAMVGAPLFPLIAAFVVWNAACMIPYLPEYGLDSLRDGAMWGYSAFALIVYGVLTRTPDATGKFIARFRGFSVVYGVLFTLGVVLAFSGSPFRIRLARTSDTGAFLGGVSSYFLLAGGSRLVPALTLAPAFYGLSASRSAGLATAGAVALATALGRRKGRAFLVSATLATGLIALTVAGGFTDPGGRNVFSNFRSVADAAKANPLESESSDGTARWRLIWWTKIWDNTVTGENFWTGRGYGRNIAVEDGFESEKVERHEKPLRSPHSGHLNYLARSGVPGAILWVTLQLTWAGQVLIRVFRSKAKGQGEWNARFAFLLCFWLALITNAAFSVFLENPVGGIWLWTVFGVGLASMHTFDRENRTKRTAAA
ncbi:MAG: O-Antigen ligase [Candidatus Latescibacteria bacterium ADurb.Bin168]|nr:MAG: O-Antigen ligase [Candidatus Latescibacteria bacterium ADurb.Bin168]